MTALPKPGAFALPDMWRLPVELGFSIIPIRPAEKVAAIPWKAYQTAKADEATVRGWAAKGGNVGIVTGAVSGLIVLDLDNAEAIAEAERRGLPDTITVRTGKGRHIYFAHPGGTLQNGARIFPDADFRGDGGYVVAPGSIHPSGSVYAWDNPPGLFELASPPAWLLALLRKPAIVAAEAEKLRRAAPGTRNDQLNKAAFRIMQDGANDPAEARSTLAGAAMAAGLDPQETRRTLDSGWDAGRTAPRRDKRDAPSEDDIALAFTARHCGRLLFDHDVGAWFEWDGTRWRQDGCSRAFSYARQLGREGGASGKATFAGGVERFA